MRTWAFHGLVAVALLSSGLAPAHGPPRVGPRPAAGPAAKVDMSAMQEAMAASEPAEGLLSSATYAHFLRARLQHHQGNHREAADELLLALASDASDPYLLTQLSEEYARMGDLPRAERQLKDLLDHSPQYAPAQVLLGHVLLEEHKFNRAKLSLQQALKMDPRNTEAYLMLAQVGLETNRPDEAVSVIHDMAAVTGEPLGLKRLGGALAERGDLKRAEPLLSRATQMDPGDADSWVMLAQVKEGLNDARASEAAYAQALEHDPDNMDALLAAGRVALKLEALPRARAYFDRLLSLSDDPEVAVKVAFSYLAAQQLPAAAQVLDGLRRQGTSEPRIAFYSGLVHEKALEYARAADAFAEVNDPELQREAQLHMGLCLARSGRAREAVALLGRALQQRPDDLAIYPAYAQVLELAQDRPGAERFLRQALERKASPELYEALADLLQRTSRLTDAIQLLQQGLQKRPNDELLRFSLAAAYERNGDFDHSLAQMRQVLALNPENAAAMNFIGYTLAEKGVGLDEAERLLLRALELKPDNGSFMDSLGWVYFRRGDLERAVWTLERAAKLAPDEPVIMEHLGDAYRGASRAREAAAAYRRALEALDTQPEQESAAQRTSLQHKLKQLAP